MKQGTKSILIGCHQFFWHPLFVYLGWIMYHNRFPKFWELICIILHDIGVYGTNYLEDKNSKLLHPVYGMAITEKLFGKKGFNLIGGHSLEYIKYYNEFIKSDDEEELIISNLFYADKYSYLIIPNFILSWQHFIEFPTLWKERNNQIVREMAIQCLANKKDMHREFLDRGGVKRFK